MNLVRLKEKAICFIVPRTEHNKEVPKQTSIWSYYIRYVFSVSTDMKGNELSKV